MLMCKVHFVDGEYITPVKFSPRCCGREAFVSAFTSKNGLPKNAVWDQVAKRTSTRVPPIPFGALVETALDIA